MIGNIRTRKEYREYFAHRHPDKVPVRKKVKQSAITYAVIIIILAAINVLSAGHTIPSIKLFYPIPDGLVLSAIGIAGFLGIEGVIVFLMSRPDRGGWEKFAIFLAFVAALTTNLFATVDRVVEMNGDGWLMIVGFIIGITPPAANLAFGEIFHKFSEEKDKMEAEADKDFQRQQGEFNKAVLSSYRRYLDKVGVEDEDLKVLFMSEDDEEVLEEALKKGAPTVEKVHKKEYSSAAIELAEKLDRDGTTDLTYSEIRKQYGGSNSTIRAAKEFLDQ